MPTAHSPMPGFQLAPGHFTRATLLLAGLLYSGFVAALDDFELYTFKPGDHKYIELGVERINDRLQRSTGSSLRGDTDRILGQLQRLLDDDIVTAGDRRALQDMGMVLGEELRKALGMHWVFYVDAAGRSRALQLRHSKHLLFPVTMISRRAETGLRVDVREVYRKATAIIEPHRNDFSAQKYSHMRKVAKP